MKTIKNLTETAISLVVVGMISMYFGFNRNSFSAETYMGYQGVGREYGFIGFGILLILTAIVLFIVMMDKLSLKKDDYIKRKHLK